MNIKPEQYGDEELLQSVQEALKQWKWMESIYREKENNAGTDTAENLKKNYLELLMEVRKRNLSLTPKQLLSSILFPSPSIRD